MKHTYPAVFTKEDNGQYSVIFNDFEGTGFGCSTGGDNLNHAIEMAQDALNLILYTMEEQGVTAPKPSEIKSIVVTGENDFVSLIACDTDEYKRFFEKRAVRKTLTIPSWLNAKAEKEGINFSAVLQDALKVQLGV